MLREILDEPWQPVTRAAFFTSVLFYAFFLLYAATHHGQFLFIDNVNLMVHEAGHLLFSWLGSTMTLYGGTLLQCLVPLLLAAYFFSQRNAVAFVFCMFFFFENLLYTATYMADARAQELPLVVVGDPEDSPHDWFLIFSRLGLLQHDTRIAAFTRFIGYSGMLAAPVWLTHRHLEDRRDAAEFSS